jgi:hypothetical protein
MPVAHTTSAVKHAYNDHPCDPQKVAVVHRWLLYRGLSMTIAIEFDLAGLAIVDRWSIKKRNIL